MSRTENLLDRVEGEAKRADGAYRASFSANCGQVRTASLASANNSGVTTPLMIG